jgi:hypothetical protein
MNIFLLKTVNGGHSGELKKKSIFRFLTFPFEGCYKKIAIGFICLGRVYKCFEEQ